MCRWLGYLGQPIRLETLMYCAQDSFVGQSLHSRQLGHPVNGDGSGLGWYGDAATPGVFHTTRPAWNSGNLHHLSQQLSSHLFLAHIRASSGTLIQESNCHPFRYQKMLFQHNGVIHGYEKIKQSLDMAVAANLYPLMEGSTDTERMFFLALTYGLVDDVPTGLSRMVRSVERIAAEHGIDDAITMTVAVANGDVLYAVRYSSDGQSPSLYHSHDLRSLSGAGGAVEPIPVDSLILLSEPLDDVLDHWEEVPESTLITASRESVEMSSFPIE